MVRSKICKMGHLMLEAVLSDNFMVLLERLVQK